jgi:hypothetical protein
MVKGLRQMIGDVVNGEWESVGRESCGGYLTGL